MERLSIYEAIEHAREGADIARGNIIKSNNLDGYESWHNFQCIKCTEEHEQLADWLEELKAYREIGTVEECKSCVLRLLEFYEKGIDDYMNKLCDHCMQQTNECYKLECPFCTDGCDIVNIAEQLKAGVLDEQSI